jgi:hypothetical protein
VGRGDHAAWCATALGLALSLASLPAAAAVVALALEVEGDTDPAIEPFTEIESGASIKLGAQTQIEFLHYTTCQTIVVRGGRVTFTEQQYLVRDGEVVDVTRSKCPEVAAVGKDSAIGGVLMRGAGDGFSIWPRPQFVFVGASRARYTELHVLKGSALLLSAPLTGYRFDWPEAKDPLAAGKDYAIELVGPDNASKRVQFEVVEHRGTAPLSVVRLD